MKDIEIYIALFNKFIYKYQKHGLNLIFSEDQARHRWHGAALWDNPPWVQKMATGHRALIAEASAGTWEECVEELDRLLDMWFKGHPEIERSLNNEQN